MIKLGKKTKEWNRDRAELKKEYESRGITTCEAKLAPCWSNNGLSFAHRYKRRDPRCEHTYQGTLIVCIPCHQLMEYNSNLTEELFNRLRQ